MEIILAIVVASAVIFFGALISMGNERQRRAIDDLHEDIVRWAEQDLLIKREKLSLAVQVPDPLGWFGKLSSKVMGMSLKLVNVEFFEEWKVLCFSVENSAEKLLITTTSPADIRRTKTKESRKALHAATMNPLLALPHNVIIKRLSLGNGGFMFDLEFPLAWKALTNQEAEHGKEVWLYSYAVKNSWIVF